MLICLENAVEDQPTGSAHVCHFPMVEENLLDNPNCVALNLKGYLPTCPGLCLSTLSPQVVSV